MAHIPFRSDDEIRESADELLREFMAGRVPVPTPVEEIVEVHLRIDIVPFRGYRSRFSADGSISLDLTEITVDEETMDRFPNRYRFTLAHEVGHLRLHAAFIKSIATGGLSNWKESLLTVSSQDLSRMEYQASQFAGCLLVPQEPLLTAFEDARQSLIGHGYDVAELSEVGTSYISAAIAKHFDVSSRVVDIRLRKEGLVTQ